MTRQYRDVAFTLGGSLLLAAVLLALPLAIHAATRAGMIADPDGSVAKRVVGVAIGVMVAVYGNVIPKRVAGAVGDPACATGRQAVLRYAGWTFFLAGLADALVWLVAPIDSAANLSEIPIVIALILVALRLLRLTRWFRA